MSTSQLRCLQISTPMIIRHLRTIRRPIIFSSSLIISLLPPAQLSLRLSTSIHRLLLTPILTYLTSSPNQPQISSAIREPPPPLLTYPIFTQSNMHNSTTHLLPHPLVTNELASTMQLPVHRRASIQSFRTTSTSRATPQLHLRSLLQMNCLGNGVQGSATRLGPCKS